MLSTQAFFSKILNKISKKKTPPVKTVSKSLVTLDDWFGSDQTVVDSARVSFDSNEERTQEQDKNLIRYLATGMRRDDYLFMINSVICSKDPEEVERLMWKFRHTPVHHSPFNHCFIRLKVEAPIFVARQLVKHKFMPWNEMSRRYVSDDLTYYFPEKLFTGSADVKQGRSPVGAREEARKLLLDATTKADEAYRKLQGDFRVCPEQARMMLPQNTMTKWVWSGTLHAFTEMYNKRIGPDVQAETREVADKVGEILEELYPVSFKYLTYRGAV